jgi:hypothetical protein
MYLRKVMRKCLLLCILFSNTIFAGEYSYSCEVNNEYTLHDDGTLKQDQRIYIGSKFNVERKSGVVLGDGVGNSSYPTKQVIDAGSNAQSYKLIWISREVIGYKGSHNSVYLNIEEYNSNSLKPFTLHLGSTILSGQCK